MNLDTIAQDLLTELKGLDSSQPQLPLQDNDPAAEGGVRDMFLELLVLALANLYTKMPLGSSLFDRAMVKSVTGHLPDNDAGKLMNKAEDWIRQEQLVRVQEGQKSYSLSLQAMAALSIETTSGGSVGALMEQVKSYYIRQLQSPELRSATRRLAAAFLTIMAKG